MSGETLGGLVALLVVVVALVLLLRRISATKRVTVAEQIHLEGPPADVAREIHRALAAISGVRVGDAGGGRYVVVIRRCPVWAIIPVFVIFPVGLIFLLFKEDLVLEVNVFDASPGTIVQLLGPTEQNILDRVRSAVTRVPVA